MTIGATAKRKQVAKISSTWDTGLVYHRIIWHGVRQRDADVVVVFADFVGLLVLLLEWLAAASLSSHMSIGRYIKGLPSRRNCDMVLHMCGTVRVGGPVLGLNHELQTPTRLVYLCILSTILKSIRHIYLKIYETFVLLAGSTTHLVKLVVPGLVIGPALRPDKRMASAHCTRMGSNVNVAG